MVPYLTTGQAAQLFGTTRRTATRRAQEAAERGDPQVVRVGQVWAAPEAWWREHLQPKRRGRPPLRLDDPLDAE